MCGCMSAIEIQTTGTISMKFGMGILLYRGKVRSWDLSPYPNPRDQGGPKQGLLCLCSLNCLIWRKLYKTKVVGQPCFSGGGSHFWIRNLDLEGTGPHVLLEPWSIIIRQSL